MTPGEMGRGIPETEVSKTKIAQKVMEIKEETPKSHLPEVIENFETYLELRILDKTYKFEDLPQYIKNKMEPGQEPSVEFMDRMYDFEPWADFTEIYGYAEDGKTEKWTIDELKQLIAELKK